MKKLILVGVGFFSSFSFASPGGLEHSPSQYYNKHQIVEARFGGEERQELLQKASQFQRFASEQVAGQEETIQFIQLRLQQYLKSLGTRSKEPIAIHLMGLSGVGKNKMIDQLERIGLPMRRFNAQTISKNISELISQMEEALEEQEGTLKPLILFFDELDKVAELGMNGSQKVQQTVPLIGLLNQILSEGKVNRGKAIQTQTDFSNVMIVTAMNFPPSVVEEFAKKVLKSEKEFYEFGVDDFYELERWIQKDRSAVPRFLSQLFRPNTVSRFNPNTVIVQSLTREDYRQIVKLNVESTIQSLTQDEAAQNKQIQVKYSDRYIDFLTQKAIYAPSGARETVAQVRAMTEYLIHAGMNAKGKKEISLAQPRMIEIDWDPSSLKVKLTITPQPHYQGKIVKADSFIVQMNYNERFKTFSTLTPIANEPPVLPEKVKSSKHSLNQAENEIVKKFRKKEIRAARFGQISEVDLKLADRLNQDLKGQQTLTQLIEDDLKLYLSRTQPTEGAPLFRVLAGFPGTGKSKIVKLIGQYEGLPIAKINMQTYTSEDASTLDEFMTTLSQQVSNAKLKSKNGKYIVLFEELDKVYEVDPNDPSHSINRPVMSHIKDLLADGVIEYNELETDEEEEDATDSGRLFKVVHMHNGRLKIDLRDALIFLNMNFSINRFHFDADPRLTSVEDVIQVWNTLREHPSDVRSLFETMFLPETINRLFSQIHIVKPLEKKDYEEIIQSELTHVIQRRTFDDQGRNKADLDFHTTRAYQEFLYREAVIPSEGARYTVNTIQNQVSKDLEFALAALKKSGSKKSEFLTQPVVIQLDFHRGTSQVVAHAALKTQMSGHVKTSSSDVRFSEEMNVSSDEVAAHHDSPSHSSSSLAISSFVGSSSAPWIKIHERSIAMRFPYQSIEGSMISENRLHVATHEFGHAITGIRFGLRFDFATPVSPSHGTGGYVKNKDNEDSLNLAKSQIADIYMSLGSRAMERIFLSQHSQHPDSVMDISSGASSDIEQATQRLWHVVYLLGFDPNGGVIERTGEGYAPFARLGEENVHQLGRVLRKMEDYLVDQLLQDHPLEWYRNHIVAFARTEGTSEKEFYQIIGYPYPGDNPIEFGIYSKINTVFHGIVPKLPEELQAAMKFRQGESPRGGTAIENLDKAVTHFKELLRTILHPSEAELNASIYLGPARRGWLCGTLLTGLRAIYG